MSIRLFSSLAVLAAAAAAPAQVAPREAAKAFKLDSLDTGPVDTTVTSAAAASGIHAVFTLDTPVQDLIANTGAKAVLDKDLPGMSDDDNLDKFKMLSLRQLQPQTGGQLTDAMLAKVASDLDVLAGGTGQVVPPAPTPKAATAPSRRNRDTSR